MLSMLPVCWYHMSWYYSKLLILTVVKTMTLWLSFAVIPILLCCLLPTSHCIIVPLSQLLTVKRYVSCICCVFVIISHFVYHFKEQILHVVVLLWYFQTNILSPSAVFPSFIQLCVSHDVKSSINRLLSVDILPLGHVNLFRFSMLPLNASSFR